MWKVIELFAGVGCQAQAYKNTNIEHEIVGISEIDKYALFSYGLLHNDFNNLGDITKINHLPKADMWTYSFPCQDISLIGKRNGFDKESETRSSLLWEVERLLLTSKTNKELPKVLVLENVKALISKENKDNFNLWLDFFTQLGYTNYYDVVNSFDYDVPQKRQRVFVVSILGEHKLFNFNKIKTPSVNKLKEIIEIGNKYIDECNNAQPNDTISRRKIWNENYKLFENNKYMVFTRTITTKQDRHPNAGNIEYITNKNNFRYLTPRECWLLMGWNNEQFDKVKDCNFAELYKQAGNGIVIPILEEIFKEVDRCVR